MLNSLLHDSRISIVASMRQTQLGSVVHRSLLVPNRFSGSDIIANPFIMLAKVEATFYKRLVGVAKNAFPLFLFLRSIQDLQMTVENDLALEEGDSSEPYA
jgi:hypothetical protein